ncbi:CoA-transferase family III [Gautieria morchelliformis]|nr:CoA-transferase family III [Gautieria morchelliformis]
MTTPLSNTKVVEFAGLAPGPFCGLFLADWGASVTRIDRPGQAAPAASRDLLARGKRSIAVNLKARGGTELLKKLIAQADVLIDPFRPGVLERLGLGPDVFLGEHGLNPKLIYTRVVGQVIFSPSGHHKDMAGHDLNYLAISGVLSMMPPSRSDGRPSFPINLLADFAGGGLMAATGVLLALLERHRSGLGQVVETDMVSGARYVSTFPLIHHALHSPLFSNPAGGNPLDGGAPYYGVYRCKDDGWFSVGALEPQFFAKLLEGLLAALPTDFNVPNLKHGPFWRPTPQKQLVEEEWADMRAFFEAVFLTKTRDQWTEVFDGKDACAVPVLTPAEAAAHSTTHSPIPHPHPSLSRTPAPASVPESAASQTLNTAFSVDPGTHTDEILRDLGVSHDEQQRLIEEGVIGNARKTPAGAL